MSRSLFGSFRSTSANGIAGATVFWTIANDGMGQGSVPTTESISQIPFRNAGRFSKLTCVVANNDRTTSTLTTRVASGAGNQSVSITASTTGNFSDLVNTDSVAGNGDLWNLRIAYGTGGTATTVLCKSIQFTPNIGSQTLSKYAYSNPATTSNVTAASTTYFFEPTGFGAAGVTSETGIPFPVRTYGTLKNLSIHASTNTSTSVVTVVSRKNSGAGSLTLSITALTTGVFEDATNSQSMLIGDTFNYAATSGTGTVGTTIDFISSSLVTPNGYQQSITSGAATTIAANVTRFIGMGNMGAATTETSSQNTVYSPFFVSQLFVNISTNTVTATSTGTFRIGAVNGTNTVSIGSGITGNFSDTTHLDKIVSPNLIDLQMVTGATGSSLIVSQLGWLMQNVPDGGSYYVGGV